MKTKKTVVVAIASLAEKCLKNNYFNFQLFIIQVYAIKNVQMLYHMLHLMFTILVKMKILLVQILPFLNHILSVSKACNISTTNRAEK